MKRNQARAGTVDAEFKLERPVLLGLPDWWVLWIREQQRALLRMHPGT
jgi:hypothetical protein